LSYETAFAALRNFGILSSRWRAAISNDVHSFTPTRGANERARARQRRERSLRAGSLGNPKPMHGEPMRQMISQSPGEREREREREMLRFLPSDLLTARAVEPKRKTKQVPLTFSAIGDTRDEQL